MGVLSTFENPMFRRQCTYNYIAAEEDGFEVHVVCMTRYHNRNRKTKGTTFCTHHLKLMLLAQRYRKAQV